MKKFMCTTLSVLNCSLWKPMKLDEYFETAVVGPTLLRSKFRHQNKINEIIFLAGYLTIFINNKSICSLIR